MTAAAPFRGPRTLSRGCIGDERVRRVTREGVSA